MSIQDEARAWLKSYDNLVKGGYSRQVALSFSVEPGVEELVKHLVVELERLQLYVNQPLDRDFYRCPNTGHLVYRWADERHVLVRASDLCWNEVDEA